MEVSFNEQIIQFENFFLYVPGSEESQTVVGSPSKAKLKGKLGRRGRRVEYKLKLILSTTQCCACSYSCGAVRGGAASYTAII